MRRAELDAMFDRLDAVERPSAARRRRDFVRWPFRHESIEVRLAHPGGNVVTFRVACRNLSRGGMSVLHNSFVHPGSVCTVVIPHPGRGPITVAGTISRCQHRSGVVHELGIRFNHPIDARTVVQIDPFSNAFSLENIAPSALHGRLLIVSASAEERRTLSHYLRETTLAIECVASLHEAVLSIQGREAVLVDTDVPDAEPATIVATLRECGYAGPVVLTAPDRSVETRARLAGVGAQALVVKPLSQELVLGVLAEVLLMPDKHSQPPASPAAAGRSGALASISVDLRRATCARSPDSIRQACLRLRSISDEMGWSALERLCAEVSTSLSSGRTLAEVAPAVDLIISACEPGPQAPRPAKDGGA
jgi:DNA-binding response OmpR family regulator